ncbi:MAG: hypothetical protein ACP5D2_03945, partial [Candidatus Nanoarchaeia archaeon]
MAKKTYGPNTIERLKADGYSNRAIEDITLIAHKHSARVNNIENMLSQGYNPKQVDEIYAVARQSRQTPKIIAKTYDIFKPTQGNLGELVEEITSTFKGQWASDRINQAIAARCLYGNK